MGITFSAADRLSITRRQLNIVLENKGYDSSTSAFTKQGNQLLQVDNGNAKFHDAFNTTIIQYELEGQQIDGAIAATYTSDDLTAAAKTPNIPPFFPSTPTAYALTIPLISSGALSNPVIMGRFHPTGTAAQYEGNIITSPANYGGVTEILNFLLNGVTGSAATTTTTTAIPGGIVTALKLTVLDTTGFTVGQQIYINAGTSSGIYVITATDLPTLAITVSSVIPSTTGITAGTLTGGVVGFTDTERQSLTSSKYQEVLTTLTTSLSTLLTAWQTNLTAQVTALTANDDTRAPYAAQNTAAKTDANAGVATLTTWAALPNTGTTGKYSNASLAPIQTLMTERQAFATTRATQISAALGGPTAVVQTDDTFSGADQTALYYQRYQWINFRINRASGSLRRYYAASQSSEQVGKLKDANVAISGQYDAYFLTKALTFNDGTNIIHVTDVTGLSVGDSLTAISETQPELAITILAIQGTTQLKVSAPIPATYTLADKARVFKSL